MEDIWTETKHIFHASTTAAAQRQLSALVSLCPPRLIYSQTNNVFQ